MTAPRPAQVLLQVCPNDHPPFQDLCRVYERAARQLGWRAHTLVLAEPFGEPLPSFHYVAAASRGSNRARGRALRLAVRQLLDGREPVLALCHRYRAFRVLRAGRLPVDRTVVVAHEFGFFRRWPRRLAWRVTSGRGWRADARRTRVAGVSDAVRDELACTDAAAFTLPNGIDLARSDERRLARADARTALALPVDGFQIGVIGRLHPKKAPNLALAAFRRTADAMPGARLTFIGDGELADDLARAAEGLPVGFAGFVADASRYLPALDLLVLPSGGAEAFGMVALEALAARVPVLCGPVPGPRFVLGECGRVFDPYSAESLARELRRAWADHHNGVLSAQAERGRERVQRCFSVPAAAARLARLAQ